LSRVFGCCRGSAADDESSFSPARRTETSPLPGRTCPAPPLPSGSFRHSVLRVCFEFRTSCFEFLSPPCTAARAFRSRRRPCCRDPYRG
jgi:hypothetical protein